MARTDHGGTGRGGHARAKHPQPRHKVVGELRRPRVGLDAGRPAAPRASAGMAPDSPRSDGGHCPTHPAQDIRNRVGLRRVAHRSICRHREIHHAHAQNTRALQAPIFACRSQGHPGAPTRDLARGAVHHGMLRIVPLGRIAGHPHRRGSAVRDRVNNARNGRPRAPDGASGHRAHGGRRTQDAKVHTHRRGAAGCRRAPARH